MSENLYAVVEITKIALEIARKEGLNDVEILEIANKILEIPSQRTVEKNKAEKIEKMNDIIIHSTYISAKESISKGLMLLERVGKKLREETIKNSCIHDLLNQIDEAEKQRTKSTNLIRSKNEDITEKEKLFLYYLGKGAG